MTIFHHQECEGMIIGMSVRVWCVCVGVGGGGEWGVGGRHNERRANYEKL